jgi:hypothetical protein
LSGRADPSAPESITDTPLGAAASRPARKLG